MHGSVGSRAATARPQAPPHRKTHASAAARPTVAQEETRSFPELDCIRDQLSPAEIAAAEARATQVGHGADRVLIAQGLLDEETYLRAFADALGTAFEPMDDVARAQCPLDDARLAESAATGLLPLIIDGTLRLVLAPRATAARRLTQLAADNPDWSERFRFTSTERLERFILQYAGDALIDRARDRLKLNTPLFSAAARHRKARWTALAALTCLALTAALAPSATVLVLELALAVLFMGWLVLRLIATFAARLSPVPLAPMADADLPIYTVIAALYREAESVDGLMQAIEHLDYPREKLDVIFAVEADDDETRAAIEKCRHRFPITVVPVPAAEPRTKPKALNVALPFARGTFTVIYDAEDRPEPNQLRRALDMFLGQSEDLACVQARLCIDNTADSWITRLFTAEYAGQFDVFLDGLAHLRLPLPLGGSSNHFYTDVLRKVGAWDPYNVTEDADLGMRLARYGYRAAMIDTTTYEEAPARFGPWLRQRTRWFKGWIQTWLVHMREPRRLWRELGPAGFFAFQFVVGGNVLAALVHPLFLAGLITLVVNGWPIDVRHDPAAAALTAFYGGTALFGYLTSALIGWLGLKRRGLLATSWALLLTPLNWLMLSLAAWRALLQLTTAPYRWEKTEHGLARTSHRAESVARSLVELEQCLRLLKQVNELPKLSPERPARIAKGTGSALRQSRSTRLTNRTAGNRLGFDRV